MTIHPWQRASPPTEPAATSAGHLSSTTLPHAETQLRNADMTTASGLLLTYG
jgi:hypothetical protein